jgi:xanthine dehydrogenase small subunit
MSDPIRFVLDGEIREIASVAPTRTVLQYLREDLGRIGTKEGCAEGDCGACTVVLADADGDRVRYRAVNACIQFVPTLDGRALFTVESLKRDGALHPVQQAMADGHGAQCGFCTPGFVMSMFALYKSEPAPDRAAINDALAGNLCRCTGYRPIVEAAQAMYGLGKRLPAIEHDHLTAPAGVHSTAAATAEARLAEQLRSLQRPDGLSMQHTEGAFHAPSTLAAFAKLREAHPDARILAGGTDVGLWVTKQLREPGRWIRLGEVDALRGASAGASAFEIGAAVSLADAFALLRTDWPELDRYWSRFASPAIRASGTLVGNLANGSPIGDAAPVLIALGASVVVRRAGADGARVRELPLEDLYVDYRVQRREPGEWIERVRVPRRGASRRVHAAKLSKRFEQDISAVSLALSFEGGPRLSGVRITLGGMAGVVRRAPAAEAALEGATPTLDAFGRAGAAFAADFSPLDDPRASREYRLAAAGGMLVRAWHVLFGDGSAGVDDAALDRVVAAGDGR